MNILWWLLGTALAVQENYAVVSSDEEISSDLLKIDQIETLIENDSFSFTHSHLRSYCSEERTKVAVLIPPPDQASNFECLTTLRYHRDFKLYKYKYASTLDRVGKLALEQVSDDFTFELTPGPTSPVHMSNGINSTITDVTTHVKSLIAKKYGVAFIYNCSPNKLASKKLVEQFGHSYFDGLPQRKNIVQKDIDSVINKKKFASAGYGTLVTKSISYMTPGVAYEVSVQTDGRASFDSFIGVEYLWTKDGLRYPEDENGFFTTAAPVYHSSELKEKYGYVAISTFHDFGTSVSVNIKRNWSLSIALIVRRNLDLFTWLVILYLIPKEYFITGLINVLLFAGVLFRMVLDGKVLPLEVAILTFIAFSLANTLILLFCFLLKHLTALLRKFNLTSPLTKYFPVLLLLGTIPLKIWGLLPTLAAMQMFLIKTMISGSTPIHASAFLVQLIATTFYIIPKIPDIMAAVQYGIPLRFNLNLDIFLIWALIFWTKLLRLQNHSKEFRLLRYILQVFLVIFYLPSLTLANIWPSFCVYLTINFLLNLIPS